MTVWSKKGVCIQVNLLNTKISHLSFRWCLSIPYWRPWSSRSWSGWVCRAAGALAYRWTALFPPASPSRSPPLPRTFIIIRETQYILWGGAESIVLQSLIWLLIWCLRNNDSVCQWPKIMSRSYNNSPVKILNVCITFRIFHL